MTARIADRIAPGGFNRSTAVTFNAPGFNITRIGSLHSATVLFRILNSSNYRNLITNYQITKQRGLLIPIDPVVLFGIQLGSSARSRSVNDHKLAIWTYHGILEFFDILQERRRIRSD